MGKRILIITTYYPPDTAIAAVRPYMLAKYLTRLGHKVTVLRSGEINAKADRVYLDDKTEVTVYSYLGEESLAERFERGETIKYAEGKSRISFLPSAPRRVIAKIYHKVFAFTDFKNRLERAQSKFEKQKDFLNRLKAQGKEFDVVFATYGELENVYAGKYASELFGCKYILDLRDPIAQREFYKKSLYKKLARIQREAVLNADICTCVSEGLATELRKSVPEKEIITLYNGFEPIENDNLGIIPADGTLSFCYTGQLYSGKRDVSPMFNALSELQREQRINLDNVIFSYAGNGFDELKQQAERYGVEMILRNCGYLGRDEIQKLQAGSDIFTVLSWNTKKAHGVLTGKFYEGIRCGRPILTIISGNEANSELKNMNEKYHYGFCYEEANKGTDFEELKSWLFEAYQAKMSGESLNSKATLDFSTEFRYDQLAKKLDEIISNL